MDLNALVGTILSQDSISSVAKRTDLSERDVQSVMQSALPLLLNGAKEQANAQATAAGFAGALNQHAQSDTADLPGFFGSVDLDDGAKIVDHLLGAQSAQAVARKAGVSSAATQSVLSAAAPLLMSLLGKENQKTDNTAAVLMSTLLGNADLSSLIGSVLGASTTSSGKKKKKKKAASGSSSVIDLLGKLLK